MSPQKSEQGKGADRTAREDDLKKTFKNPQAYFCAKRRMTFAGLQDAIREKLSTSRKKPLTRR